MGKKNKKDKEEEERRKKDAMSHKGKAINQWPPENMTKLLSHYKRNEKLPEGERLSLNKLCKIYEIPYNTGR